jgi:hypothetical protein
MTVKGNLTNNGLMRRGPGYAAYGEGNLAMLLEKDFTQNGTYVVQLTRFTGSVAQTITQGSGKIIQGLYYDMTPASGLKAGSALTFTDTKFVLGSDSLGKGSLAMGGFTLSHASGTAQIDSGMLSVDTIFGAPDNNAAFTINKITAPSGTLVLHGHYSTSSVQITGNLLVATDGVLFNEYNVLAAVNTSGTTANQGVIRCGPGYASYDGGHLILNGVDVSHPAN